MCDFRFSPLSISNSRLIKSKLKRQQGKNLKQNHAVLEENLLQTDSSGKDSCCYGLHTEKATWKTTT